MEAIRVRYMVNDLDPAVTFYTQHLGFQVKMEAKPHFAIISRGPLDLVLSTPFGPGGAAKPMLDGRHAEPGGWNRIIINVDDLAAEVARLQKADIHFPERNRNRPRRIRDSAGRSIGQSGRALSACPLTLYGTGQTPCSICQPNDSAMSAIVRP